MDPALLGLVLYHRGSALVGVEQGPDHGQPSLGDTPVVVCEHAQLWGHPIGMVWCGIRAHKLLQFLDTKHVSSLMLNIHGQDRLQISHSTNLVQAAVRDDTDPRTEEARVRHPGLTSSARWYYACSAAC